MPFCVLVYVQSIREFASVPKSPPERADMVFALLSWTNSRSACLVPLPYHKATRRPPNTLEFSRVSKPRLLSLLCEIMELGVEPEHQQPLSLHTVDQEGLLDAISSGSTDWDKAVAALSLFYACESRTPWINPAHEREPEHPTTATRPMVRFLQWVLSVSPSPSFPASEGGGETKEGDESAGGFVGGGGRERDGLPAEGDGAPGLPPTLKPFGDVWGVVEPAARKVVACHGDHGTVAKVAIECRRGNSVGALVHAARSPVVSAETQALFRDIARTMADSRDLM
jgi:hypothetical protein